MHDGPTSMSTPEQWSTALKNILIKASVDSDFREKCLTDPAAAIHEASGLTAPAGLRFAETADGNAIVLPPLGADPDEITNSELLGNVAGGSTGYTLYSLGETPDPAKGCNW